MTYTRENIPVRRMHGTTDEPGYRLSRNFGIWKWPWMKVWILTHLPSGMALCDAETIAKARAMVAELERMRIDWGTKKPGEENTAWQRKRISRICGTRPLRPVA